MNLIGTARGPTILIGDPNLGPLGYFDWQNPDVRLVSPGVLAQGQASIIRFKGFTSRPVTTAEHALRVGRFARHLAPQGLKVKAERLGLFHDAHEPLTPWGDCPSPWKTPQMKLEEARLDKFIWEAMRHWGVHDDEHSFEQVMTKDVVDVVKIADLAALYYEAIHFQAGAEDWVTGLVDLFRGHEHALLALFDVGRDEFQDGYRSRWLKAITA